jgi:hypothetical protein
MAPFWATHVLDEATQLLAKGNEDFILVFYGL